MSNEATDNEVTDDGRMWHGPADLPAAVHVKQEPETIGDLSVLVRPALPITAACTMAATPSGCCAPEVNARQRLLSVHPAAVHLPWGIN